MAYSHGHEWTDKELELLKELAKKGCSTKEIAVNFGMRITQIRGKLQSEGVKITPREDVQKGPTFDIEDPIERLPDQELSEALCARGYKVEKIIPDEVDRHTRIDPKLFEGEKIQFAVLSCTHLGSKYQQLTHLYSFYRYIQDRGIKVVLHAGDMVDGIDVYDGHKFEIFIHGVDAQRDYAIEHYPKMENGGKTFVISGNHDHSFQKRAGSNIVKDIAAKREDIEYLGIYGAYPSLPRNLKVYIQHGSGGPAYAQSYKMQRNIEKMSPEKKPDLYFLGHFHSSCLLLEYRNVSGFMLPSFQAQTPHAVRNGWPTENGGFIITITINDRERKNGISKTQFEFVPFYVPLEKDY